MQVPGIGRGLRHARAMGAMALGLASGFGGGLAAGAADAAGEGVEHFEKFVRPVLVEHCYPCHAAGAEKVKGHLWLDSKAGWSKGGTSGKPAVVPGDVEGSPLVRAIRRTDPDLAMPPKQALSKEQVSALEAWVAMGAPDPRTGGAAPPDPKEQAAKHWAFQPVRKPEPPSGAATGWARGPIDRFVGSALERAGLRPSGEADRRTLLRRASFVLTGLAPTAEEVVAFEADGSPEAYERVIDRLLASPRYGERWARYWLDVARYADTKGYVFEEERRYPYAYTYRDWVIRAFNEDMPYDRFLVAQVAGDQVATEGDKSSLAAMGFLTLGRRFLNNPHDIIDDRIDVLMRGTMALTVGCARCHDHKSDPIPLADYYSLYGVFASSEEPAEKPLLGTIPDPVRHAEFEKELARRERERDEFVRVKEEEHRKRLRETVGDHLLAAQAAAGLDEGKREELARSRQLSPMVVGRWIRVLEKGEVEPLFGAWRALAAVSGDPAGLARVAGEIAANAGERHHPAVARLFDGAAPGSLEDVAKRYNALFKEASVAAVKEFLAAKGTPVDLSPDELHRLFNVPEGQRKRALQRAVEELQATHPGAPPRAMALRDKAVPVEPVVFKRGNPGNPGDPVPRRFLEVLAGPDRQPFRQGSGRLELAQAIASPDNPLTARVMANRVWLQLFGAGLVRTPADFGVRTEPPSHPELLDWLAATFVEDGWSLKRLQRRILLSATWRQSSDLPASGPGTLDPDNRWWSRQNRRRLDFESTRDFLLQAAGTLDLAMGGHSVEVAAREYQPRRTVYGFVERQNLPGVFRTFDFASPDTTSAQRFQTTVPQQALYFLNGGFALDQARRLARRPDVAAAPDLESRVKRLHAIVFQRAPDAEDMALAREFLGAVSSGDEADRPAPVWQHGTGRWDEAAGRVLGFRPLPHFTGKAWQGGTALPDPALGWVMLNAEGGHPGGPGVGAAVRRWTAPASGAVEIAGTLKHPGDAGDGVRGYVVSSRAGVVGRWTVRKGGVETGIARVEVQRGDTLDFVVDCGADENTDGFEWSPRLRQVEAPMAGAPPMRWDARTEFGGPGVTPAPLSPWESYAQVLLMANEAVFYD